MNSTKYLVLQIILLAILASPGVGGASSASSPAKRLDKSEISTAEFVEAVSAAVQQAGVLASVFQGTNNVTDEMKSDARTSLRKGRLLKTPNGSQH